MLHDMDPAFAIGDVVVFTPDAATVRRYGAAFARLRIYPGYVGPVERITAGLVRVGGTRKAWPATQFRLLASFAPGELAVYRDTAEYAHYADRGPNPYRIGDRVRFRPSDWCDLVHGDELRAAGLYPTCVGQVTAVQAGGTIEVDHLGRFVHWSEFEPA